MSIDVVWGGLFGFALTVIFYAIKQRIAIARAERWAENIKETLNWRRGDTP